MKKIVLNIFVISLQLLMVGLFFMTIFSEKVNITKKVSIVDNENFQNNKISKQKVEANECCKNERNNNCRK